MKTKKFLKKAMQYAAAVHLIAMIKIEYVQHVIIFS